MGGEWGKAKCKEEQGQEESVPKEEGVWYGSETERRTNNKKGEWLPDPTCFGLEDDRQSVVLPRQPTPESLIDSRQSSSSLQLHKHHPNQKASLSQIICAPKCKISDTVVARIVFGRSAVDHKRSEGEIDVLFDHKTPGTGIASRTRE